MPEKPASGYYSAEKNQLTEGKNEKAFGESGKPGLFRLDFIFAPGRSFTLLPEDRLILRNIPGSLPGWPRVRNFTGRSPVRWFRRRHNHRGGENLLIRRSRPG